jgi:hypothetical protein
MSGVLAAPDLGIDTLWSSRYAERMRRVTSSAIRELLKLTEQPDVISFAGGLPAPEVFPLRAIEEAAHRVLEEQGSRALQYSTTEDTCRCGRCSSGTWPATASRSRPTTCS